MVTSTPAQLLHAFLRGAPHSADDLARHALTIAFRAANLVLHDQDAAFEVAQDVAVETLQNAGRVRDPGALNAWIARVSARSAVRTAKRRRKHRQREVPLDLLPDDDFPATDPDGLDDRADHVALGRALRSSMESLPRRQREVLVLHYTLDMTHEQIASVLGMRPGSVGAAISRARATLRESPDLKAFSSEGGER